MGISIVSGGDKMSHGNHKKNLVLPRLIMKTMKAH